MRKSDKQIDEFRRSDCNGENLESTTNSASKYNIRNKSAKFVVNAIIYVNGKESDESSDDESLPPEHKYNPATDEERFDKLVFNDNNQRNLPFRSFIVNKNRAQNGGNCEKFSNPVGFLERREVANLSNNALTITEKFVDKLYESGLEENNNENIQDVVSVSILLNRPLSLSSRKNGLLEKKGNYKSTSENAASYGRINNGIAGGYFLGVSVV
jgi:hypothetical protein